MRYPLFAPILFCLLTLGLSSPVHADSAGKKEVGIFGLISDSPEEYKKKMEDLAGRIVSENTVQADADLWSFLLTGVFWGAVSLITPCVFPMIPITVSFFLKQSEKENHRPILMAFVYSLTIVCVLTLAAAFLLKIFFWLSIHPVTNYVLGGLFIFFALSLFGMYEIELPNSLAQFTASKEGSSLLGTVFMALTFTIISFACVAPFLGGFGGTAAAARPMWQNLLGGLAFSIPFASPFFLLALFPTLLRAMPKSGAWLNSVKVVMGFLELAAGLKFIRSAELAQTSGIPSILTFDLVLGIWIALCFLCGLYLLGLFRLPHDSQVDHIGVPRLLFSIAFLGLGIYLAPALFKTQRPAGTVYAWVDSFLLPDGSDGNSENHVTANLPLAVAELEKYNKGHAGSPKRIFLDVTGVQCTNCRINERNVLSKSEIQKLLDPFTVVQLYTDTVPANFYAPQILQQLQNRSSEDAQKTNLSFENKVFDDDTRPLYAILEPQGDHIVLLARYGGRITDEAEFIQFLRHPEGFRQKE